MHLEFAASGVVRAQGEHTHQTTLSIGLPVAGTATATSDHTLQFGVMRDALSDVLQHETMYAPVVDADRRIAGVLSVEIISDFLGSEEALSEEHMATERPAAE